MNNTPPIHTAAALDWEPRRDERRDFWRSLLAVVVTGACAVVAGVGALAILHVGITPRTVALCAAPLLAGVVAFLVLAPIEGSWRAGR